MARASHPACGLLLDTYHLGRSGATLKAVDDVAAGRALYVAAARRRDAGLPSTAQAAMAKLFCTDMAMKVTTDAVQVLGGYGYVSDFPAERYMREAKVLQIVEGTNQVQRIVIGRHLQRQPTR
jgi:alkylation response protein AidB-like acyl-CoA dehydrogenase